MSRPNFRPRPIDVYRPLPIVRSARDLEDDDQPTNFPKDSSAPSKEKELDPVVKEEVLLQEQLAAVNDTKTANIPVPKVDLVDLYDADNPHKFDRPQQYIRFKELTLDEQDGMLMYMCETDDEAFIKEVGGEKKGLPENKFEMIIDRLEKETFKLQSVAPVSCLEGKVQGRQNVFQQVYDYWVKKRKARGDRALIRKFQAPTSMNDPSPHATFRPREREQKNYRRTRKNDKDAYQKLASLRLDFDRARTLLSLILNRERLKKDLVDLCLSLENSQVLKDKDPLQALTILREQESKLKRRQAFVFEKKPTKTKASKKEREAQLSEDDEDDYDDLFEDEEEEEEEESQPSLFPPAHTNLVKLELQRLLADWDDSSDDECPPGSSVLPVTGDGILCGQTGADQPVHPSRRQLSFFGRPRMGRGGRLVFDRCRRFYAGPGTHRPSSGRESLGSNAGGAVCNYQCAGMVLEVEGSAAPERSTDKFRFFADLSDAETPEPTAKRARLAED